MSNLRHFLDRHGGGGSEFPIRREGSIVNAARMIVGLSANAALLTDTRGMVSYMNYAAEALTGLEATNAVGRLCGDLLRLATLDERKSVELPVDRVLADARTVELPHAFVEASNGRIIAVQGSVAPILDDAGQIAGTLIQLFESPGSNFRLASF